LSNSTLIYEWLRSNDTVLMWLGILSVVMFLSTLLAVPFIVSRIPTDYFIRAHRPPRYTPISPFHLLWTIFKNVVGIILFAAGIAMLVLPGQGVLTMLLGVMLMNFPGKYELERQIIQQPTILKALNWMRRRTHRPDLLVEQPHSTDEALR
jgi:Putative transmembrane protein (PGPGW)